MVVQPTYEQLQAELREAKKQIAYEQQKARRHENSFRVLYERVCNVKSKKLDNGDKIVLTMIYDLILFKSHDFHDRYRCIDTAQLKSALGGLYRIDPKIQRLIKMRLIEQESIEHLPGEYWLAIPDDIYDRLKNISEEFDRNWHASRWCSVCQKNVAPKIRQRTHQIIECPNCHSTLDESFNETVYFLGERSDETPLTREEFFETDTKTVEPNHNGHIHSAAELLEQLEDNGWRILASNVDDSLLLNAPSWASREQWYKARDTLRPFDSEIVALVKARQNHASY